MTLSQIIELPHKFIPRNYQEPFWRFMEQGKRAVLCWHRRSGKDKTCWNFLIKEAFKKIGVYYYIFPTYNQGKKIIWDGIDKEGMRLLKHIPEDLVEGSPNSTEMKIRVKNGSLIQVIGSNNIDSLVGTNPVGCLFSEYALQDPRAWIFLSPILAENGGWSIFESTPRGKNHFYDLCRTAENDPKWFYSHLTVEDTGVLSQDIIEEERKTMCEDLIRQEYYCSFDRGVEGSYYNRYIEKASDEGRIGHFPYSSEIPVHTAWDLGWRDGTSVIFFQKIKNIITVIDYYEDTGKSLSEYLRIVRNKPYVYGKHFGPHDVRNKHVSTGLSAYDVAFKLGFIFTVIPNRASIIEGIEASRLNFNNIQFDSSKCSRLIKCLENYRKTYDPIRKVYSSKPLHDEFSHGADAFRYMNLGEKIYGLEEDDDCERRMEEFYEAERPRFHY